MDVCDCVCVCVCVSVCMCVCVCVALCVKEGSQVAAPDLLTQLHSHAQECAVRRKREKREFRSMLVAVCVSSLGKEYSHVLHPKVHECISTELCVLCSRQSSGLQLACSTLAHLNIETQICSCVYVCLSVCLYVCA